jgi:hypothetical protein
MGEVGWDGGGGYSYVTLLNVPLGEGGGGRLFWAQMALASLVAISGPKKSLDFQGPPLPLPLIVMDLARLKTTLYKQQVH